MLDQLNTMFVVADAAQVPTAEATLSEWFTLTDTGVIAHNDPPQLAYDVLVAKLETDDDINNIQRGDACIQYYIRFGADEYEKAYARLNLYYKLSSVTSYASVLRRVPYEARVPGLSLDFYRLVSPLYGLPDVQRQLLQYCKEHALTHSNFEQHVNEYRRQHAPATQPPPPRAFRSDRLHETEQELYQTEIKRQEAETAAAVAVTEAEQLRQALWSVFEATLL